MFSPPFSMRLSRFPFILVSGEVLSGPVNVKCGNPGCGKLNPVYGDVFPGREYTCVFCGHLFKAQPVSGVEAVEKGKRLRGKKSPRQRESRPQNRNMRKPLL